MQCAKDSACIKWYNYNSRVCRLCKLQELVIFEERLSLLYILFCSHFATQYFCWRAICKHCITKYGLTYYHNVNLITNIQAFEIFCPLNKPFLSCLKSTGSNITAHIFTLYLTCKKLMGNFLWTSVVTHSRNSSWIVSVSTMASKTCADINQLTIVATVRNIEFNTLTLLTRTVRS